MDQIYFFPTELITCTHSQPDQDFVLLKSTLTKLNIYVSSSGGLQRNNHFPGDVLWKSKFPTLWHLVKLRNTCTHKAEQPSLSSQEQKSREQANCTTYNSGKTRTHAHLHSREAGFVCYRMKPQGLLKERREAQG